MLSPSAATIIVSTTMGGMAPAGTGAVTTLIDMGMDGAAPSAGATGSGMAGLHRVIDPAGKVRLRVAGRVALEIGIVLAMDLVVRAPALDIQEGDVLRAAVTLEAVTLKVMAIIARNV